MNNFSFFNAFKSLISVIFINIIIIYSRINKKKIIFYYHSRKLTTGIHTYYIEDLFKGYHQHFILIYEFNHDFTKSVLATFDAFLISRFRSDTELWQFRNKYSGIGRSGYSKNNIKCVMA